MQHFYCMDIEALLITQHWDRSTFKGKIGFDVCQWAALPGDGRGWALLQGLCPRGVGAWLGSPHNLSRRHKAPPFFGIKGTGARLSRRGSIFGVLF